MFRLAGIARKTLIMTCSFFPVLNSWLAGMAEALSVCSDLTEALSLVDHRVYLALSRSSGCPLPIKPTVMLIMEGATNPTISTNTRDQTHQAGNGSTVRMTGIKERKRKLSDHINSIVTSD